MIKMVQRGKKSISLSDPILGDLEKQALISVIDSKWITMGEKVVEFENAFAAMHGQINAVAVNSCTAGLHLCLASFGITQGDEVLVPSLTFVATVNSILYVGAKPIFVDIENYDLPHISLEDAKSKVTEKTKAIIIMHYGGYLLNIDPWRSFAESRGLILIEDAAHAPGVRNVGLNSHAAVFSFFGNKNMTTAEGGMILTANSEKAEIIRKLRAHGMTTNTLERHRGHAYSYDISMLGFNYRLDELRAAVGLVQLSRLQEWNEKRRKLTYYYRQGLNVLIPEVIVPFHEKHETSAHLMPILLPAKINRIHVMQYLRDQGVQSSIHYPPVHLFSYYKNIYPGINLPRTEEFCRRELTLPLHPSLFESDLDFVMEALQKAILENE